MTSRQWAKRTDNLLVLVSIFVRDRGRERPASSLDAKPAERRRVPLPAVPRGDGHLGAPEQAGLVHARVGWEERRREMERERKHGQGGTGGVAR